MSSDASQRPVVFLSVFKSGTHLVRHVLERMTGLAVYEPPIHPGRVDYSDLHQLRFLPGHFYSWHLIPEVAICERLQAANARTVFIARNLGDLAVSMYHHFAANIDDDIGRGRNVTHHFSDRPMDAGLGRIIDGIDAPDFRWRGIGPHARQISLMLAFAASYPSFMTTFERITTRKVEELRALAEYLAVSRSPSALHDLVESTSFAAMRQRAAAVGRPSHYRRGEPGEHRLVLTREHWAAIARQLQIWAPDLPSRAREAGFPEIVAGMT